MRHADAGLFERLASMLARFADDFRELVRTARPYLPEQLDDRAQDNWEPPLSIAGCWWGEFGRMFLTPAWMLVYWRRGWDSNPR
ncbi:MAG: DUF3631 domain-containing protein [Thiobacillus sp.]